MCEVGVIRKWIGRRPTATISFSFTLNTVNNAGDLPIPFVGLSESHYVSSSPSTSSTFPPFSHPTFLAIPTWSCSRISQYGCFPTHTHFFWWEWWWWWFDQSFVCEETLRCGLIDDVNKVFGLLLPVCVCALNIFCSWDIDVLFSQCVKAHIVVMWTWCGL